MKSNMLSRSSSLAGARVSHSVHGIRFSRVAPSEIAIGVAASNVLPWFGTVVALAFIVIVAIVI
jgi:hypothetical protein